MEHKHHTEEEHFENTAVTREDPDETAVEEIARVIKKEEKKEWMLPASILIAALMISIAFVYSGGSNAQSNDGAPKITKEVKAALAVTPGEAVLGKADAKITIVEYGDFQCPFCVMFYKSFEPTIIKELVDTGIAKYVFRPFPIVDQIARQGTESVDSSRALLCAKDQGKFWEMHSGLYEVEAKELDLVRAKKLESNEVNGNLNKALFVSLAKSFGMNEAAFTECYSSDKHRDTITAIEQNAGIAGVQGTPSLFVNNVAVDLEKYGTPDKFVQYVKTFVK